MDGVARQEVDLMALLAEQQYRRLAMEYELEGLPVPAHVAAEANHLAVIAALADEEPGGKAEMAGFGGIQVGKLFKVSDQAEEVEVAFRAANLALPSNPEFGRPGVIISIDRLKATVKLQFAQAGASGWYPIVALHAAYLKPPKKTAAQLEQEAAPKFDPKWDGLFAELRAMTMGDLRIRALVEEVDEDAVYDSMDAADPKEALVELIVEAVRFAEEGPAGEPEQPGEDDPFGRKEREKELEAEEKRRRKAKARKRWRPQSSRSLVRSAKMRAATRIQAAWRGVHLRARRGRAREEAELAAEAAKHAELAGVLRTLELSCWDEAKMLPPEVEARERDSEAVLNARKLFARIKGGKLRTIILAMSSHAVARRRRRLEHRAITKLQAAWRGIHARWHFRRHRHKMKASRRGQYASAEMLMLQAQGLVKPGVDKEKVTAKQKIQNKFKMDPKAFKHRTMAARLNFGGKTDYQLKVERLFRNCVNRMKFEQLGWCWDCWLALVKEARMQTEFVARRDADEAYSRARKWMDEEQHEAAAAGFTLALKEKHPDIWGCWYMRGLCCNKAGKAADAVKAFNEAINTDGSRPAAWYHRSVAQLRLGQLQQALDDLRQTLELDPRNSKAAEQIKFVRQALHEERELQDALPDIKRDGKAGYNATVFGQHRLRPLAPSVMQAYRDELQLSGGKQSLATKLAALPSADQQPPRFATSIIADPRQIRIGEDRTRDRPEFGWPEAYGDPLQDIGADYPINPFHPEGHDEDEVDDKLDEDDAEEAFPFTAEEVERLDLAVSLKGEQDWAGVAAMLGARTAEGCKEEWDRRRLRWTAGGEWLGHTMDRRLLAGRTVEQEAEIAKQELELRLAALECTHKGALVPSEPRAVYRAQGGRWHCDECGDDTPPGRMYHCRLCGDFDLCAECMRDRQHTQAKERAAAAKGRGGRWNMLQADGDMAGRVLSSNAAMGVKKHTKDLLTGERFDTKMEYFNPYKGAQLVNRQIVYPARVKRKGSRPARRLLPGMNPDEPDEKERGFMKVEEERHGSKDTRDYSAIRSGDAVGVYGYGGSTKHTIVLNFSTSPTRLMRRRD